MMICTGCNQPVINRNPPTCEHCHMCRSCGSVVPRKRKRERQPDPAAMITVRVPESQAPWGVVPAEKIMEGLGEGE